MLLIKILGRCIPKSGFLLIFSTKKSNLTVLKISRDTIYSGYGSDSDSATSIATVSNMYPRNITYNTNKQHSKIMESHTQKYDILKRKYYNIRSFSSNFLPIEALEQCIRSSHENAATKIQSAWRGYCCRKAYRENKTKMKESNAALVIQRSVREWFHKRKTEDSAKLENRTIYCLEKLDESRIPDLQEEINKWNVENKDNFESQEKLQSQLETVQQELKKFYERAATRKSRVQRCEAICTQIEAISSILSDLPSLVQCEQLDISMFQTPVVADAKIAKIRHKQQLKAYSAPWWKRLNMQNDIFM